MAIPTRVLVVDDHFETRLIMTRILSRAGFETVSAASKSEALAQCREAHFDVLISDLLLSDGDGLELLQEILGFYPIRSIACSGMGDEERDRCLSGGFEAYFCKPIQIESLLKTLAAPAEMPFILAPCDAYGEPGPFHPCLT